MERMREHVFRQADTNKDDLISLDEFIAQTKSEEFNRDPNWETVDNQPQFTHEEYMEFERQRQEEIQRLIAQGALPPHPQYQYGGYQQGHPNQAYPQHGDPNQHYNPQQVQHPNQPAYQQQQYQQQGQVPIHQNAQYQQAPNAQYHPPPPNAQHHQPPPPPPNAQHQQQQFQQPPPIQQQQQVNAGPPKVQAANSNLNQINPGGSTKH